MKTTRGGKYIIHRGICITPLPNGKFMWLDQELSLDECKRQIDKTYGGKPPTGNMFTI